MSFSAPSSNYGAIPGARRGEGWLEVSRRCLLGAGLHGGLVHLGDVIPVHQMVEERLDVVGPPVAVVDVIGVLPHITAQDRRGAMHQWAFAIGGLCHDDL